MKNASFHDFPEFVEVKTYRVVDAFRHTVKRTDTTNIADASAVARVMSQSTEDRPSELFMVVDQDNLPWAVFIDGIEYKRS